MNGLLCAPTSVTLLYFRVQSSGKLLHGRVLVGWAELVVLMVTLALVVAFTTAVPLSKVDVDRTAPVKRVTEGEVVVCLDEEAPETFLPAMLLERRATEPSRLSLAKVLEDIRMVEE